jgi:hypothetical protein
MANNGTIVHGYDSFKPLVDFWNNVINDPMQLSSLCQSILDGVSKDIFREMQQWIYYTMVGSKATLMFVEHFTDNSKSCNLESRQ